MKVLFDTNILIDYLNGIEAAVLGLLAAVARDLDGGDDQQHRCELEREDVVLEEVACEVADVVIT